MNTRSILATALLLGTPLRLLALALSVPLLVIAGPSAEARVDVDHRGLASSPVPYLVKGRLHLPSGKVKDLPFARSKAGHLQLMGRGPNGWLIADRTDNGFTLFAVRGERKQRVWSPKLDLTLLTYGWRLGDDGRHLLQIKVRYNPIKTRLAVIDLTTGEIRRQLLAGQRVSIRDFNGSRAVLSSEDGPGPFGTVDWTVGDEPRFLPMSVHSADIDNDTIWVGNPEEGWGPTSLAAPGTPPWASTIQRWPVTRFVIDDTNEYVAERYEYGLKVRRISDGTIVQSLDLPLDFTTRGVLVWADGDVIAEGANRAKQRALFRCDPSADCKRITPWIHRHWQFSVPFDSR